METSPRIIELQDYRPPTYAVEGVDMTFQLFESHALVTAELQLKQHQKGPLSLDGEELELLSLELDGEELAPTRYQLTPRGLTIHDVPTQFTLRSKVKIYPRDNKSLQGLYQSGQIFCTQCEAEGFRRITYFLDRPDVMSVYRVRIEADQKRYPCLLSNGNPVEKGALPEGRHFVTWQDPFAKPCYLFALVAGDLGVSKDRYITASGRNVALEIYCDKGNEGRCLHAMDSLKKAMKWDEETFGLEYDLDIYMIVAVDAFNMGAMENKGLNIFNSSCVLADPQSATDHDYQLIEGIIAHEYFHNWTGNRVTCRDWFQLTLKEGLTVYRDQEFSADMQSRPVQRIETIKDLKRIQFPEDAGPLAHPIRPRRYIKIDNFYTATVYDKGAEVIRMVANLIGTEKFRQGMDKYFELYDGQAVTTEDFLHAMERASGYDLTQFRQTWYDQAGTPLIAIKRDAAEGGLRLHITQSTPTHPDNRPYDLPFPVAFYGEDGKLLCREQLRLSKERHTFDFPNVNGKATPSFNLGFASPVRVAYDYSDRELSFLMANDRDECNRFQAGQQLAMRELLRIKDQVKKGQTLRFGEEYFTAYQKLLEDESMNPALKAYGLGLPSFGEVIEEQNPIDFEPSELARRTLYRELATRFAHEYSALYHHWNGQTFSDFSAQAQAARLIKNTALAIWTQEEGDGAQEAIVRQYEEARNMTDAMAALQAIVHLQHPERERIARDFYDKWHKDPTVYSKWLRVMAGAHFPGDLDSVRALMDAPRFDLAIPNQVRSLLMGLASNPLLFHHHEGTGYRFVIDFAKKYDSINPLTCARLVGSLFGKYPAMDRMRRSMVGEMLKELKDSGVSENTYEVVDKICS